MMMVMIISQTDAQKALQHLEESHQNTFCQRPLDLERRRRYDRHFHAHSSNANHSYLIAANLHNNEALLSDFVLQLLNFLRFLQITSYHNHDNNHNHNDIIDDSPQLEQPNHHYGEHRIFVSIYESGSTDRTADYLQHLRTILEAMHVHHRIVSGGALVRPAHGMHRIEYLASVRNAAMQPLYDAPAGTFHRVLFLNDIFFCGHDLAELLLQSELQEADVTCGLDYDYTVDGGLGFYDSWVARDRRGAMWEKRPLPARIHHMPTETRVRNGLPVGVGCCW